MPDIERLQNDDMHDVESQYSEDTQEILGRVPSWIVRWGITAVLAVFVGIVIGCYFIKFPQVVTAPVVITTLNPPSDLMARSTGRIDSLFVNKGDSVEKNSVIALLYNTADYKSVMLVGDSLAANKADNELIHCSWIDREYSLGDVQPYYLEFRRVAMDYRHYIVAKNIEKKQNLIRDQIVKNREYYAKQQQQRKTLERDIQYEKQNLSRDSLLFQRKIISLSDYEKSMHSLLQKQSNKESFDAQLTNTELAILRMEQQLIELSIEQDNQIPEYERLLSQAKQQLMAQIEQWKYQYIVTTPVSGRITFTKYWSRNQTVQNGERLASVVPYERMETICRLTVPTAGFGKVEVGQTVNIKLNGYPHMEFGMLKGKIASISDVPDEKGYMVEATLPTGLVSTYNKKLNLIQQMDGTAEIITQDQRLIQRFLQPIKALFVK